MENFNRDDFQFVQMNDKIHDARFETKPIGYLKDAWLRFKKNKASVFSLVVILCIMIFGLVYPFTTSKTISEVDIEYRLCRPKNDFLANFGFCDGTYEKNGTVAAYAQYYGIGVGYLYNEDNFTETFKFSDVEDQIDEFNPIKKINRIYTTEGREYIDFKIDQYLEMGYVYVQVTKAEYEAMLKWQEETGYQILFPMIDTTGMQAHQLTNANLWYKMDNKGYPLNSKGKAVKEMDDLEYLIPNYLTDDNGDVVYTTKAGSASYNVRVLRYTRYMYNNNGETPQFLFGSDGMGYDIAVRLAHGIRLSLLLAVCVSTINLLIGAVYGAIEGYYGGTIDLIMERISDILSNVPTMVVITLFNIFLVEEGRVSPIVSFILAFIATGWLGTAYRVRTQFYRFKNQEYVLAARTLGAKDARLMLKHIFPNSLGTIITSSILVIPGVIFSETSLSYLGIIDLNGPNASSIGTMLANGQQYLTTFPHVIVWPTIIIGLLMLTFNLLGNGLRDAFNPSLRGVDD